MPLPGVDVGDCGHKTGFDNIDNGWVAFNNYRVPKSALLNKLGDVTEDGKYVTNIESEGKRFGMHIASLTGGRVAIGRIATENGLLALKVALNYGLARRQFDRVILDFPLHQYRLIPRLA